MNTRPLLAPWLALMPLITACSSLTVVEPRDGSIHVAGPGVPLLARTSGDIRSHSVTVNGQAASPPVPRTAPREISGALNLGYGSQKIVVSTTMDCALCSGGSASLQAERQVCVRPATRYPGVFVTALGPAVGGASPQAWGAVPTASGLEARVVPDSAGPLVSWRFTRLAGAFSEVGVIESVEQPCRCLRSASPTPGSPLELATCDPADPLQRWQFLPLPGPTREARVQNLGRSVSDACITEGPPPEKRLIQAVCQDSPPQRWRFRDNASSNINAMPW